jgi:hypothetical protein
LQHLENDSSLAAALARQTQVLSRPFSRSRLKALKRKLARGLPSALAAEVGAFHLTSAFALNAAALRGVSPGSVPSSLPAALENQATSNGISEQITTLRAFAAGKSHSHDDSSEVPILRRS